MKNWLKKTLRVSTTEEIWRAMAMFGLGVCFLIAAVFVGMQGY